MVLALALSGLAAPQPSALYCSAPRSIAFSFIALNMSGTEAGTLWWLGPSMIGLRAILLPKPCEAAGVVYLTYRSFSDSTPSMPTRMGRANGFMLRSESRKEGGYQVASKGSNNIRCSHKGGYSSRQDTTKIRWVSVPRGVKQMGNCTVSQHQGC